MIFTSDSFLVIFSINKKLFIRAPIRVPIIIVKIFAGSRFDRKSPIDDKNGISKRKQLNSRNVAIFKVPYIFF